MMRLYFSDETVHMSPPCNLSGGWSCSEIPELDYFDTHDNETWETEQELIASYPELIIPLSLYYLYKDDPKHILELASEYVIPHLNRQKSTIKNDDNNNNEETEILIIPEKKQVSNIPSGCRIVYYNENAKTDDDDNDDEDDLDNITLFPSIPSSSSCSSSSIIFKPSPSAFSLCHVEWSAVFAAANKTQVSVLLS